MSPQKWQLLSSQDVSPSKWFPVENRRYQLPNGQIIDDFTVTTLGDVSLIIPVTVDKKVILVNQFKPGVNEVIMQFPGGRKEVYHSSFLECAQHELEEEVGIKVLPDQLTEFAKFSGFSTKASEIVYFFLAKDCQLNSSQHLDVTEDIEILHFSPKEIDDMIESNQIWCAQTVAGWTLAKMKFGEYLGYSEN